MPNDGAGGRCASCGADLQGPYCAACGEQVRKPGEVPLRDYLAEAADALFNLEGRFLRSFRSLLFQPGRLTTEYMAGRRVMWMRPLHLFLVINLVFFLLAGTTISFSTTLGLHLSSGNFPHQAAAEQMVNQRLNEPALERQAWREVIAHALQGSQDLSAEQQAAYQQLRDFALDFNRRSELVSRTLIIALVPLATVMPWLMFFGQSRSPVQHLVLATHWAGFSVIMTMVAGWLVLALSQISRWSLEPWQSELFFSALVTGPVLVWTIVAFRRVYCVGWLIAIGTGLVMNLTWVLLFLQLYRSLLFFTVFWSLS